MRWNEELVSGCQIQKLDKQGRIMVARVTAICSAVAIGLLGAELLRIA